MILSLQSIILKSVELLFESMGLLFDALTTKSLDFSSRASRKEYNACRKEYNACVIFNYIIYSIIIKYKGSENVVLIVITIFLLIYATALLARRLYDLNLRGWWQLPMWLFPISGIILCFLKGTPEANRFGDIPK